MQEDNAYIRGSVARPEPQSKEVNDEVSNTMMNVEVIRTVLKRFDERIAFYGSVDSVEDSVLTDSDAFMHTIAGNKVARQNLIQERNYIFSSLPDGLLEQKP